MKRLNLTQWIAIIGFAASIIGYVIHLENGHVQEGIARDRSIQQRDSIIQAMAVQNLRMDEISKKLDSKIEDDKNKEALEDIRFDKLETQGTVNTTRFEDFLFYYKPKK
jgi:hypothetical protein